MDSDPSPVVNLEVTVPVFPAALHQHGPIQAPATGQYSESNESEEVQQVQLVPLGHQQDPSLHQPREHQSALADIPSRIMHSIRFRIFHLTLSASGQPFLLQVLRTYNQYIGKKRRKRNQAKEDNAPTRPFYVTASMAFSVEFNVVAPASAPVSTPTLIPGMNRVVIFLDNEGTPAGYSIDGAES